LIIETRNFWYLAQAREKGEKKTLDLNRKEIEREWRST